jgi:GGDEF domain-containing protein
MKHINRFPYLSLALLAAWLIAGTVAILRTDPAPDTSFLALALILFTAIVSVANLFRFSAFAAVVVSLGVYNAAFFLLRTITPDLLIALGIGNFMIIGTGLLGWISAKQIAQLQQKLEQTDNVIQDLWVKDPILGIMRLPYALQTLKTEVIRSQRYKSGLSLMLIKIANEEDIKKEQGVSAYHDIQSQVCTLLSSLLREMDILFGQEDLGIILPETGGESTMVIARRITDTLARKMRIGVHIGVAEFGVDAFDDKELYHAAETALELAVRADKSIITFSQVQHIIVPEIEEG